MYRADIIIKNKYWKKEWGILKHLLGLDTGRLLGGKTSYNSTMMKQWLRMLHCYTQCWDSRLTSWRLRIYRDPSVDRLPSELFKSARLEVINVVQKLITGLGGKRLVVVVLAYKRKIDSLINYSYLLLLHTKSSALILHYTTD